MIKAPKFNEIQIKNTPNASILSRAKEGLQTDQNPLRISNFQLSFNKISIFK
jgi:hypothetical protein